jgi:hypothetical protein
MARATLATNTDPAIAQTSLGAAVPVDEAISILTGYFHFAGNLGSF